MKRDPMILVVEDDEAIRMLLGTVLRGRGFQVTEVDDGRDAHPAALECAPDLVLLDIGLPGLDGFGVLKRLKRDARLSDIPVIMVTAWSEPELVTRALEGGAHDYVRKPFAIDELLAHVEAALGAVEDKDPAAVPGGAKRRGGPPGKGRFRRW